MLAVKMYSTVQSSYPISIYLEEGYGTPPLVVRAVSVESAVHLSLYVVAGSVSRWQLGQQVPRRQ